MTRYKTESERQTVNLEQETIKYIQAIFSGFADSVIGLASTIFHPYDNVIVPISSLLYDATVIAAGMHDGSQYIFTPDHPDSPTLHDWAHRFYQLPYFEAVDRMNKRVKNLGDTLNFLVNEADGPARARFASGLVADVLVPGYIVKSAANITNNLHKFGTIRAPMCFTPVIRESEIPASLKINQTQRLAQERQYGSYLYVITEDLELIATRILPEKEWIWP